VVDHVEPLTKRAMAALAAEGRRMTKLLSDGTAASDVRFVELA